MAFFLFRKPPQPDPTEPLLSRKAAAAWLEEQSKVDTIGRLEAVMKVLADGCRPGADLTLDRMAAVEYLDAALGVDRGNLITQYTEHAQTSPVVANRIWQAAHELGQGFVGAYRTLFEHALTQSADPEWRSATPNLLAHLIHYLGTESKLRVLRNESWIPAKWMDLHQLYRSSLELGIATVPVLPRIVATDRDRPTIEQEYIAVLLTHALNTGTLTPPEIDWVAAQVRRWAEGLELCSDAPATGGLVVDIDGRSGLGPPGRQVRGRARYLDMAHLTLQLDRTVAALRAKLETDADATRDANRRRIAILEKLRPVFAPETSPALPRDQRVKVEALAQVRIGLADICRELGSGESRNLPPDLASPTAPAGAGSVVGGDPPAGERLWHIDNRSDSGMRLIGPVGAGQGVLLGGLVAIREPGDVVWGLGVVRRVTRPMTERVEIGVAIVSDHLLSIALHAKRHARDDMGFVVDGVDVSTIGERFDGLLLRSQALPDRAPGSWSLIVAAAEHAAGRQVILVTQHTIYTVAMRQVLERQVDWTWVVIEILAQAPRH